MANDDSTPDSSRARQKQAVDVARVARRETVIGVDQEIEPVFLEPRRVFDRPARIFKSAPLAVFSVWIARRWIRLPSRSISRPSI